MMNVSDKIIFYMTEVIRMNGCGENMTLKKRHEMAERIGVGWRTLYRYDKSIKKYLPADKWRRCI